MDKDTITHSDNKDHWSKHKTAIGCISLFFLPFLVGGVVSLLLVVYQFYKVQEAKSWKPVHATVQSADFITTDTRDGGSVSEAKVQYEYVIAGKSFTGNKIAFGIERNSFEKYSEVYDKLNNARIIQIYVNENDPADSVIIRDVTNAMIVLFIFSCMLNSLLMIFLLPLVFKQINPRKVLIFTVIVWVVGLGTLLLHVVEIDIAGKVIIVEQKEEEYIYIE